MIAQERTLTALEFWALAETLPDDGTYELINGEIIRMNPPRPRNSFTAAQLTRFIGNFADEHDLGYVFGADGGYTLAPGEVRIPDVSFVSKARWNSWDDSRMDFPPDLAVEVISPGETPRKIHEKTALYLNAGTRQVWNVYPDDQVIEVWQQGADRSFIMQAYKAEDTLNGGDVLPGFTLLVGSIFPQDDAE